MLAKVSRVEPMTAQAPPFAFFMKLSAMEL